MGDDMKINLEGKIAVVTGGSRGLGRRTAERLARHGAKVAVIGRSADQVEDTRKAIVKAGGKAVGIAADASTIQGVDSIKQSVESALGPPDILINAAGVFGPIELIKDGDPHAWIQTIMANAVGHYLTSRAFAGGMVKRGWGRIVNFSSAAALHPPGPLNSAYGTSKAALNHMTRHLAVELAGTGVTANVIHPGDVRTDMWADIKAKVEPLGPIATGYITWVEWVDKTGGDDPEKCATLVLELMSDEAAGTTGQFLWIDDPLQKPIPSWGEAAPTQPWRQKQEGSR
jgi:NAD(P)-dependent dehydrogenase (short-subunit alcohol dehydrogenase family)